MTSDPKNNNVVFMECGILHYFHYMDEFMSVMNALLKPSSKMICSDFHPLNKISDVLHLGQPAWDNDNLPEEFTIVATKHTSF